MRYAITTTLTIAASCCSNFLPALVCSSPSLRSTGLLDFQHGNYNSHAIYLVSIHKCRLDLCDLHTGQSSSRNGLAQMSIAHARMLEIGANWIVGSPVPFYFRSSAYICRVCSPTDVFIPGKNESGLHGIALRATISPLASRDLSHWPSLLVDLAPTNQTFSH